MKHLNYLSILLLVPGLIQAQDYMAGGRKSLAPLPAATAGSKQAVSSLAGTWTVNLADGSGDKQIHVPGEAAMQGFNISHDKPFRYTKEVTIPADAAGKALAIRFNGVYNHAKVWVDGQLLREHYGGFTAWECDITPLAKPGKTIQLTVEVTDRIDDISFASGYAHHPIGGILRDVQLVVRPQTHITRLYANTSISKNSAAATLDLDIATNNDAGAIAWTLNAADGKLVAGNSIMSGKAKTFSDKAVISHPKLWTAETPDCYLLTVTLRDHSGITETVKQYIGFREISIRNKNELLVNGLPVKLRGACHHDMHPTLGRSTNRQQDSLDIVLAKEANMNFIRTSHYPPSADLLEFADRYGIYIQEETAICFVGQDRGGDYNKYSSTQNDTSFTSRYMGQLSEMIDKDRNHPSVIMWSIGNESSYGSNFQQEYDFVKRIDPSRPVSWSWPMTALKGGKHCFDIAVAHYPEYHGKTSDMGGIEKNMANTDFPLLSDEWAHVACYNTDLLAYDPNVKDFWGRSLDTMWLNRFPVPGNAGGAIWGMIDETFHLPGKVTGYGPWGIIDVWRRKKTEFWNTTKAYSPIRIAQYTFPENNTGTLDIPVFNRFDHLNLKDITCRITSNGKTTTLPLPDVTPHQKGVIRLPVSQYKNNSVLMQFFDKSGRWIDEEKISWGQATNPKKFRQQPVTYQFDGNNGQLQQVAVNGIVLINGAPDVVINTPVHWDAFKNSAGIFSGTTSVADIKRNNSNGYTLNGTNGKYPVKLAVNTDVAGKISIDYTIDSLPAHTWEVGIKIPINGALNKISWKRNGYWSTYPEGHLSANEGHASKNSKAIYHYREHPVGNPADDMTDYYLAASTDEAKANTGVAESYHATKENIQWFSVYADGKPARLTVISDGSQAAKMQVDKDGKQWLIIADKWDYWSLSWGNYQGSPNSSSQHSGSVKIIIE